MSCLSFPASTLGSRKVVVTSSYDSAPVSAAVTVSQLLFTG